MVYRIALVVCSAGAVVVAGNAAGQPARQSATEAKPDSPETRPTSGLIDLTYPFDEKTIYWPTAEGFVFKPGKAGVTERGYYYVANSFCAAEHGGTHIDAPIHFYKDHETVDQIPLRRLVGPGVVVDVRDKCAKDPDYLITVQDLHDWEEKHGTLLADKIVLLQTGFGRYWPDRKKYLGTDERGPEAVPKLHFPGLDPEAAQWLTEQRQIRSVGIDTASIDRGQSQLFGSHVALFKNETPAFENVAHLDKLPAQGFTIMALPMKIAGGSGGPLRIIAQVPVKK